MVHGRRQICTSTKPHNPIERTTRVQGKGTQGHGSRGKNTIERSTCPGERMEVYTHIRR